MHGKTSITGLRNSFNNNLSCTLLVCLGFQWFMETGTDNYQSATVYISICYFEHLKKNDTWVTEGKKQLLALYSLTILVNQLLEKSFDRQKWMLNQKFWKKPCTHVPWQNYHQLTTWVSASFCFLFMFFIHKYYLKECVLLSTPSCSCQM